MFCVFAVYITSCFRQPATTQIFWCVYHGRQLGFEIKYVILDPVRTIPAEFENGMKFLRLGLRSHDAGMKLCETVTLSVRV